MKSSEDIERLLECLGKAWPDDHSIVESVMRSIESIPARPSTSKRRRIVMRSLVGTAASVAILALLWWGILSERNSLYAQVISAVHSARTVHTSQYAQPKEGAKAVKVTEAWFERGVGFRQEGLGHIRLGNEQYLWNYSTERKTAARSESNGIAKATAPIFAEIEQIAQQLRNEFERCPASDRTIGGQPCKAYVLAKLDRYSGTKELTSGKMRLMVFLDPQVRPVRTEYQWCEDGRYVTKGFASTEYDEPIDPSLFKPDFGKGVKIVDADAAFDDFVSLKSAVHVEERSGLIYAIHRVERFEGGGVLVVSSVRGTEETLKKYPLTKRCVRPGEFLVDGPARDYDASPQWAGFFRLKLARATHQGIDLSWWSMIPRGTRANWFEVAPGRIKLQVGVTPAGEFAKLFRDKNGVEQHLTWDIDLDVSQPATIATFEQITNRIYADQVTLESVTFKSLDVSNCRKHDEADIGKITAAEYTNAVANNFRSWMESDIDGQIDGLFDPKRPKPSWLGNRVPMGLSYESLVNDATLERIAKRPSVTELYLRGTRITDSGLRYLSGLAKLNQLDLAETGITDAGVQSLRGLSSLKHLDLTDTKVTAEGVAMLKQAIPKVEIRWKAKGSP